jgi:hypothetical protein
MIWIEFSSCMDCNHVYFPKKVIATFFGLRQHRKEINPFPTGSIPPAKGILSVINFSYFAVL